MSRESKLVEEKINEKLNQSDAKGITLYDLYLAGKDNFYQIYNNLVYKNNKELYKILNQLEKNGVKFVDRKYVIDEESKRTYIKYHFLDKKIYKVFDLIWENNKIFLEQNIEVDYLEVINKTIQILSSIKDEHNTLKNNLLCLKEIINGLPFTISNNNHNLEKVHFKDLLFHYNFDFTKENIFYITFSDDKDFYEASTHDKLYDYLDFYKESFLRKVPLNINKLNPLYKNILMNYLIEKDEKELILKK